MRRSGCACDSQTVTIASCPAAPGIGSCPAGGAVQVGVRPAAPSDSAGAHTSSLVRCAPSGVGRCCRRGVDIRQRSRCRFVSYAIAASRPPAPTVGTSCPRTAPTCGLCAVDVHPWWRRWGLPSRLPLIWFSVSVLGGLVQPLAVQVRVCVPLPASVPAAETVRVLIFERHPHTDRITQLCTCGRGVKVGVCRCCTHFQCVPRCSPIPANSLPWRWPSRWGHRFAGLHLLCRQRAGQRAAVFAVLDGERDGHALGFGAGRAGAAGRRLRVEGLLRRGRVRGDGGQRRAADTSVS